jgi:hypothetical protein
MCGNFVAELLRARLLFQSVATAPYVNDIARRFRIVSQFTTQPFNHSSECVIAYYVCRAPYSIEKLISRDEMASMTGQVEQHIKFSWCEIQFTTVYAYTIGNGIYFDTLGLQVLN